MGSLKQIYENCDVYSRLEYTRRKGAINQTPCLLCAFAVKTRRKEKEPGLEIRINGFCRRIDKSCF